MLGLDCCVPIMVDTAFIKVNCDRFLAWLHTDSDVAGEKYEVIRRGLPKYFARQTCHVYFNCPHADELTDETINRVVSKMDEVTDKYREPERRIFAFAKYVRMEHLRNMEPESLRTVFADRTDDRLEEASEKEKLARCHGQCLGRLSKKDRYFITEYFNYSGRERIEHRRKLATELEITQDNLAVRALRLRRALHDCLLKCLQKMSDPDVMDH